MATFRIDQATPGAGVAGQSRHDLVVDEVITLTATQPTPGAGVTFTWEILDKVGTTATLSATTGTTVTLQPNTAIDEPCSFLIQLTADDNGTVTTTSRIASVRGDQTALRVPVFPETAPTSGTLGSNDASLSTDNAVYTNRGGLGSSEQNWRGWAEWAWEVVTYLENTAGGGPTGAASGDLSGTYPGPTVARIQGTSVHTVAPTDGQVLQYVAANLRYEATDPTGAPTGTAGGDLAGTYPNPTVDGLQGVTVSSNTPTDSDFLAYNGQTGEWEPTTGPGSAFAVFHFVQNGQLSAIQTPTNFIDGLRTAGVGGTIDSVVMTQEEDGTSGATTVELYKVDTSGTETQISVTNSIQLSSGGGAKARVVSTSFQGGGADTFLSTDRLGIKLTSVQGGAPRDLEVSVIISGNSLLSPVGLPEDDEVTQAINESQLGTTWLTIGQVYLQAGTIDSADSHLYMGVDNSNDDVEFRIQDSGATTVATITNTGLLADVQPASDITIASAGWYSLQLRSDNATATATILGYKFVYSLSQGTRIRQAILETVTGTTASIVGAVYLPSGTLQAPGRIFCGAQSGGSDSGIVRLRRESDSQLIATWTCTGLPAENTISATSIPTEGWYTIELEGSGVGITGELQGIDWTVLT